MDHEFDSRLKAHEQFQRDFERASRPYEEGSLTAAVEANGYAQVAIKSGLLLNGGAILALPALVALFGADASSNKDQLVVAGGIFIAGLLLSWLASLLGFFAMARRADELFSHKEHACCLVVSVSPIHSEDARHEHQARAEKWQEEAGKEFSSYLRFRKGAIVTASSSYFCFVVGAGCAAYLLST